MGERYSKWRNKWRDLLRDENFWLGGYNQTDERRRLARRLSPTVSYVNWNVGVGPAANSFVQAITRFAVEAISEGWGPFDPVIKVQLMKPPPPEEAGEIIHENLVMSLDQQLTGAVAEQLGLLNDQEYREHKEAHEEARYFSWGSMHSYTTLQDYVDLRSRINAILSSNKYLLAVDNLYSAIQPDGFSHYMGLPLPTYWTGSRWLISTMSQHVCDESKSARDHVYGPFDDDDTMVLILSSLHQSAKDISKAIVGHDDEEKHWHRAVLRCFHYALLQLLIPCEQDNNSNTSHYAITSEELIRQWAAQGFLATTSRCKPRAVQAADIHIKGHHANDIYQVGHAILQAFSEYSLLKLPFSPASEASKATETAAHFLIYHHLVASQLIEHEIFHEEEEVGLKNKRWIRMTSKQQGMENQAWHLSTQLLGKEESNDPTTFILRHFLHTSTLLNLIDNILPKLPCLRVLDLSYTQLESLPPTVWCLSNLILLSLRGCRAIKSLHSVSNSGGSHPENEKHRMMNNLLYLDLTLLSINIFPNDFFQGMTKLEELMLAGCSSLVELPCSIFALSSLLTLEVTGTKLTSLPSSMFAGMQKLQSLKLIDNKLLNSIPMSILEARGLKELHIQGWHSRMQEEINLDGHPTLNSF
ncbi:uncharacterized protein LOC127754696 [Oryza glaberrima]|uniref:uncharacterized protein LOC127754696 n=1 Tax=Oryza glaberrima TaxID=4538 RepID=UPI00224C0BB4|nr:uncharacterized protein LOC127754696 [Oryza glaberrima]